MRHRSGRTASSESQGKEQREAKVELQRERDDDRVAIHRKKGRDRGIN